MPLEFTDEQHAVINHTLPGHGRVFAGPGTGKSATAVGLAERLLGERAELRLKFLTFTRAATLELGKKLPLHGNIKPATVHSFSIATLLQNPGCAPFPEPLRMADKYEYDELVRPHLARRARTRVLRLDELVREMAAKWESLNPAELPDVTPEERARFMGAYTEHRRTFGYTLLDELPELLRCALRDHADLSGVNYDLFIVDEYQDLNACELELLKRIADRGASIIGIGDDDQSIYSFRKAHAVGIRRFLEEYAGARDYALSICQRLPQRIAQWAQYLIGGEPGRVRSPITCRATAPEGTAELLSFGSEITEARGIGDLITWLNQTRGIPLSEILVLSRTDRFGTFTRHIRDELARRGIPVFDPSEIDRILAEPNNRKLVALLRLAVNRRDSLAWWTLANLEHGIGSSFVDVTYDQAVERGTVFADAMISAAESGFEKLSRPVRERAVRLYGDTLATLARLTIPEATGETKWGKWLLENGIAAGLPQPTEALKAMLIKIDETYPDGADGLGRYLAQIQPLSQDLARAQSDSVRFMTMVSSKGLTVRATFVVGVDNDLVPRPGQDLSEERRLLYVAMTRSTEFLFLTWANRRTGPAARAGNPNPGRRTYSEFLRGGPVESTDGSAFIRGITR